MAAMPPSLMADLEHELYRVERMLDRCVDRLSAMAVMAAFPDPGDEPAGESRSAQPRRLPPPPLHRGALPPTDED